jgi:hypothetical protein
MFSILHITDLHRAKGDPISNSELLSALISDRERYEREDPPIRPPDAIVVSGDVIQGVGLNAADYQRELANQYDAGFDLLASLTDRFLDGDRSKVVIVPGNHDVDWNVAFASMEPVADHDMPAGLPGALYEPSSPYRWDWKSRQLYRIKDATAYGQRLAAFWNFFERFYAGTTGLLRVVSWSDANLYSLDDGRIGIAAFNSCASNDCFAFHGEIPREVVAQAHLDLKDRGPWRLRIAVWHHDIEGPPHRSDYMDPEIVRGMIGRGFRLGLYGHQHRTQITPQHANLPDRETMAIASAGSLCAGWRELPTGARRGYSIVEIRDDFCGARVHVREMTFANLFSRAALNDFGGRSFVDLKWTTPLDAAGRPEDPIGEKQTVVMRQAEDALRRLGDPAEALRLLGTIDAGSDPFGRRLMVEAARLKGDAVTLAEAIGNPRTIEEVVLRFGAQLSSGDIAGAEKTLADDAPRLALPEPLRADLALKVKLAQWKNT